MSGHFDVARLRLVPAGPVSDNSMSEIVLCAVWSTGSNPELPRDRLITYLDPKRFVGCMKLSLSDPYLPA